MTCLQTVAVLYFHFIALVSCEGGLPEAPLHLGLTNIRSRSALLQFIPGSGDEPITRWIVEAQDAPQPQEFEESTEYTEIYQISDPPSSSSILVQNLRPFTWYRLRVIAETRFGRSTPSLPTRPFMTDIAAPEVPNNFAVQALNSTALLLTWTPLSSSDWNAPGGSRFIIYYKSADSHQDYQDQFWLDDARDLDSFVLARLQPDREYDVKMQATNCYGDSDFTPVMRARTTARVW